MHYSILIPVCHSAPELDQLLPEVVQVISRKSTQFEVVGIAATPESLPQLAQLARRHGCLKIVPVEPRSGLSVALSAGIAAARGEAVVALEASLQYLPQQIPWLLERLSRADLVTGRRVRNRLVKCCLAVAQLPRRMLLGLEARDPDCLFWAARREAVDGLQLSWGQHRFLGSLVSSRGYRVTEIHVDHRPEHAASLGSEGWPSLRNLLAVGWEQWRTRAERKQAAPSINHDHSLRKAA